jgi:cyanate lyase
VREEFGDGIVSAIVSAIDFEMDLQRVADPGATASSSR